MKKSMVVVTARVSGVIWLAVLGSGCELPAKKAEINAPTQTDRMIVAYPEIQNGRVLILADFENDQQLDLFRLAGSESGALARDAKSGRVETGSGALSVTLTDPEETVVVASPPQGDAFLKRDWRPYDLLLMAVKAPRAGIILKTQIVGGVSGQSVQTGTDSALVEGWNFLRYDLAEIGEQVPLDDIREVRLGLGQSVAGPVTLQFDDLLLVGNRKDLMGDSSNTDGKLYVQSAGRHWNVGVPGKFEIAFRNGQITRWFNLAADSFRLRNLVRGTVLGPVSVVMDGGRVSRTTLGSSGGVAASQRIVEMNDVRVVIACEWGKTGKSGDGTIERRIFTVYPTGQVFVAAAVALTDSDTQSLAFNLAWSPNAPLMRVQTGSQEVAKSMGDSPAFALARVPEADAALLFVPYPDESGVELREIVAADLETSSIVWTRRGGRSDATWRGQLFLGSSSTLEDSQAFSRAVDYVEPGGVKVEVGAADEFAGVRSDGFDPGTGTYLLKSDGKRVRAVVMGRSRSVFSPVFSIHGGSSDESWVYVNHLVQSDVCRDPDGRLLFQMPEVALKEVVVEALFKR